MTPTTAAISPMLAQPIDEHRVAQLVQNEHWACEPKVDGHRCLIHIGGGRVEFITRTGLTMSGVPASVRSGFEQLASSGLDAVLDSELLPHTGMLWLFDCVRFGTVVADTDPFRARRAAVEQLAGYFDQRDVDVLPSYTAEVDKARLLLDIKARNAEGVIFRRLDAGYTQRRTERLLKYKFRYDCDCVVIERGVDGKDNLRLAVFDDCKLVDVGTVSALTGDGPRVQIGDVVCVTYLYASADRKLTQPVTPRIRTDKRAEECTIDQLIYPDKTVRGI